MISSFTVCDAFTSENFRNETTWSLILIAVAMNRDDKAAILEFVIQSTIV